jgi:hypothetical protein
MFIRNTAFSSFDDATAEQYMREIVEISKSDCYWSDVDPAYGSKGNTVAGGQEGKEGKEGQEGWNLMYVRLRGLAVKPPGSGGSK